MNRNLRYSMSKWSLLLLTTSRILNVVTAAVDNVCVYAQKTENTSRKSHIETEQTPGALASRKRANDN